MWELKETNDGEYAVHQVGSDVPVAGGTHTKRSDAVKHMKALYVNEPVSAKFSLLAFADDILMDTEDPNIKWVKAWRYSTWEHPKYGKVEITPQTGVQFAEHFNDGTLGRDHLVNYDHGVDAAKGGKAAGQILSIDPRDDGIYYQVRFTDTALAEIKAGEWKYLSPEYDDLYVDRESQEVFEMVPQDLAITNTPFFKGMPPLNFSDVFGDVKKDDDETSKGGNTVDVTLKKFAEKLGITLDDDMTEESIIKAAEKLNETIEPLRRVKLDGEASRTFREAFPDQWEKIQRLESQAIDTEAREFSEAYSRFTIKDGESNEFKSVLGFSTVVQEEIASIHKKFSHREATHKDLKSLLDLIGDKGIVDYSEHGSSRTDSSREFSEDPRLAFSEAISDVMDKDNLEYEPAMHMAAQKYPKLYQAYVNAIPQR